MTVLQQVKDYYLRFGRPTSDAAREITQKVLTSQGVKDHLAPQEYLAAKSEERHEQPFDNRGRFLSKQA